jgi:hypothetical protein
MPSLALQFPSGRGTPRRLARQVIQLFDLVLSALVEARQSVACYHALSLLSDQELRKRGLARETLAHFALLGRGD